MLRGKIDSCLLERFEKGLNPQNPAASMVPAEIIGYGEMSTIFAIKQPGQEGLAYKRMPIFRTAVEMEHYERLFQEYNTILGEIGLTVPDFTSARVIPPQGNLVIYNVQERLAAGSIGNRLIHTLDKDTIILLFRLVLKDLLKVFRYNAAHPDSRVGIDGQISNWAVADYRTEQDLRDDSRLFYIDTSTPLMYKEGKEQLDPELFLRSAPSFLVWLIRWLFLADVMTRYYDLRLVIIDLIANLYKEGRPDLIPTLALEINATLSATAADFDIRPITLKEINSYYRQDAMIWRVYLALRQIDRFLHLKVLHKPYGYILPGKIKR